MNLVHRPSFRLNSALFVVFLGLSVALWQGMPERYPVHFTLQGSPTRWAEGPGMWILLVALCSISFGKLHLFQRFLVSDPDSELLNGPYKRLFRRLPRERKVPVLRRANRLLGLMNLGLLLTFTSVLLLIWVSARHPGYSAAAKRARDAPFSRSRPRAAQRARLPAISSTARLGVERRISVGSMARTSPGDAAIRE